MRRHFAIPLLSLLLLAAGCAAQPAAGTVPAPEGSGAVTAQTQTNQAQPASGSDSTTTSNPGTSAAAGSGTAAAGQPGTAAGGTPAQGQTGTTGSSGAQATTGTTGAPAKAPGSAPAQHAKQEPRMAILVYHEVDDAYQSDYTITTALFEEQIQMLQAEGYKFYGFDGVEKLLAGGEGMPEKSVMLAFDDGYQSFATKVLPIAKKYGVPAVCFVVTQYADFDIIFSRPHMAPVELKKAVDSGLLELGGHSWNGHRTAEGADGSQVPVLTQPIRDFRTKVLETQAEYESRVLNDFKRTTELLQSWGAGIGARHFTFPYTARSEDAVRLGQQAGFRYFYVGGDQLVTPKSDPTAIPRVNAGSPYITADGLKTTLQRLFGQ